METKFKVGQIVCERIHPKQKLVITQYRNGIYYVKTQDQSKKDLVYLELEIQEA